MITKVIRDTLTVACNAQHLIFHITIARFTPNLDALEPLWENKTIMQCTTLEIILERTHYGEYNLEMHVDFITMLRSFPNIRKLIVTLPKVHTLSEKCDKLMGWSRSTCTMTFARRISCLFREIPTLQEFVTPRVFGDTLDENVFYNGTSYIRA
jgi:hypothetical protein